MNEITTATAREIESYLTGPYENGDVNTLADLVLALAREVRTLQAKVKKLERESEASIAAARRLSCYENGIIPD